MDKPDNKSIGTGKRKLLERMSSNNHQGHKRKKPMTSRKITNAVVKKQPGSY
jgi:hypothetical protein